MTEAIPNKAGAYYLCVEGENGAVAMRHKRVDKTAPVLAPRWSLTAV